MKTTGYLEVIPYLRGECTLEQAADAIRITTRQYARRQRTWMRHQLPPDTYHVDANREPDAVAAEIVRIWNGENA